MRQAGSVRASFAAHSRGVGRMARPHEPQSAALRSHYRAPRIVAVTRPHTRSLPLSRELPCPLCAPHEHHLLPCDVDECTCHDAPIPGLTR